jgi:hypothetical protein
MNTQSNTRTIVAAAAAAAVAAAVGFAGGAAAQTSEAVGGSTADNTSAGNLNGGGLPQIQQQGEVSYVSGGVGLDESQALRSQRSHWPLALSFTGPTSDYLSDVHVRIVDAHRGEVLSADSRGPYMLIKLRPGRYTVHASYKDRDQTKTVTVSGNGSTKADFHWNTQ